MSSRFDIKLTSLTLNGRTIAPGTFDPTTPPGAPVLVVYPRTSRLTLTMLPKVPMACADLHPTHCSWATAPLCDSGPMLALVMRSLERLMAALPELTVTATCARGADVPDSITRQLPDPFDAYSLTLTVHASPYDAAGQRRSRFQWTLDGPEPFEGTTGGLYGHVGRVGGIAMMDVVHDVSDEMLGLVQVGR